MFMHECTLTGKTSLLQKDVCQSPANKSSYYSSKHARIRYTNRQEVLPGLDRCRLEFWYRVLFCTFWIIFKHSCYMCDPLMMMPGGTMDAAGLRVFPWGDNYVCQLGEWETYLQQASCSWTKTCLCFIRDGHQDQADSFQTGSQHSPVSWDGKSCAVQSAWK